MKARFILPILLFVPLLWAGEITLDLQDTPLRDVIAKLSQGTKEEIIPGSDLEIKLTGNIRCTTLEEALRSLSILHPKLRWAKLTFPAKEKVSQEDIVISAKALQAIKLSKVALRGQEGDVLFSKAERAALGDEETRTVYVLWEEGENILNLLSTPQDKLTVQDYLNLSWKMLDAFLSMTPGERKQALLAGYEMMLQDPTLLQRMMQESLSTMMALTPEEAGRLMRASLQAMQSIPPEFWQQMMQSMQQFMQQMGPQLQQMAPQFPGAMPPMGGGGQ